MSLWRKLYSIETRMEIADGFELIAGGPAFIAFPFRGNDSQEDIGVCRKST